ncbi:hypothetical protein HD842_004616 [Massilia aurea]|uniref:Uncharacterized protein n=1 Tax=Massilia aurea TaxID=373040 RepID=A0A7X0CGP6_9BURK|nr:hypothetical protein [Massilia aurea]MBB6136438.1 hypothetical protein [Massilia aurea]
MARPIRCHGTLSTLPSRFSHLSTLTWSNVKLKRTGLPLAAMRTTTTVANAVYALVKSALARVRRELEAVDPDGEAARVTIKDIEQRRLARTSSATRSAQSPLTRTCPSM